MRPTRDKSRGEHYVESLAIELGLLARQLEDEFERTPNARLSGEADLDQNARLASRHSTTSRASSHRLPIADLVMLDGHTIKTTAVGTLLVRNVCMLFDR